MCLFVAQQKTIASEFVERLAANGTTTSLVFGAHFADAVSALFDAAHRKQVAIALKSEEERRARDKAAADEIAKRAADIKHRDKIRSEMRAVLLAIIVEVAEVSKLITDSDEVLAGSIALALLDGKIPHLQLSVVP